MKTVKFFTLGCKVNQYDAQRIREHFQKKGFKEVVGDSKANLYVINTCTVTHRADADSYNLIRRAKKENPRAKIIVTGCLVERDQDRIKEIKGVTSCIGRQEKEKIAQPFITHFKGHTRAFIKIQDGCDNFCSYCKIPFVRGKPRSRPLSEVLQEAERLAGNGYKELVLCGICLGKYGKDLIPPKQITDVITELEKIDGLWRIRLSSIEVNDVTNALLQKMAHSSKLCPHLHIPLQSGNNEILAKMNRCYRREEYLALVRKAKKMVPRLAITTDVLVGFPGETEKNFMHTVGLIRAINPLRTHIFPYSPRKGTRAFGLKQDVPAETLKKRIKTLKAIAEACGEKYKKRFAGKKLKVLIEGRARGETGYWRGYSDNYISVRLHAETDLENCLITLKNSELDNNSHSIDFY